MKRARSAIDKALDSCLPPASRVPAVIHKAMRYSVFSGGKRIRPVIVIESCRACLSGGRTPARSRLNDALAIGCAVEMAHTYSLIHDDLPSMDDDDYRRGKPSCHKAFGEANAILAGDALLTLAFNILSTRLDAKTGIESVRELSEAIGSCGMAGGQAIDIGYKGRAVKPQARRDMDRLKTGRLFEASAKLGAIAARAGAKEIRAMALFGGSIGAAFQMVDDIIDSGTEARAERLARDVTGKAKAALKTFGGRADALREIADLMLRRCV
ncbi:MAG: polyprenyl synthetase family protein [Candidatus Omnitrophota bacterium]